jgi:hypothetical protein
VSDTPNDPASAAAGQAPGQEPSEEEIRAYLGQLREAPVDQVLSEILSALLNAAQVKLGRRDGRLLIDLVGGLIEGSRAALDEEFTGQVDEAITQLRLAQVEAEGQVGGEEQPNDVDASALAAGGKDSAAGGADTSAEQARSRLWTP